MCSRWRANIRLPWEQSANPVISKDKKLITFRYFFTRKLTFVRNSDAIVLFAGAPITSLLIWSARRDFLRRLDSPELVAPAAGANQNAS